VLKSKIKECRFSDLWDDVSTNASKRDCSLASELDKKIIQKTKIINFFSAHNLYQKRC